ncbi:EAL domain-containing protein [Pseudodesulfovibrio sediminis]|uniref:Diguanylate cyclase/phosphodiesterase with PAS/PAC sensor(S) n=1 Tax=Pseudodesulfovibrio sediminis TaxID=2810563 RepID=A0ABN6EQN2_9BACT|nr:EAL domain-containing protein [Pseudodesulfovibrio sediminis]BCS88726.1 hypothetical protein PSDVSF_19680 [Pseudodesulfovibrio sediminis]
MLLLFAGSLFLYLLPSMENAILDSRKRNIMEMTNAVMGTLQLLQTKVESGETTEEAARLSAKEFIRAMRYGYMGRHYFWISDHNSRMVMHPYRPELEGQNLAEFADTEGKRIFSEFTKIAHSTGSGYLRYYWQWNDQSDSNSEKIGYVSEFKPWGWIVGTGLYVDDIKDEIAMYRNRVAGICLGILLFISLLSFYVLRQAAITEKKNIHIQSQREKLVRVLRESEERYRTIADFAYDWEAWVSPEKTVLYSSPACLRITGHPPERFFENPDLLREIIIPEDQNSWDTYIIKANSDRGETLDFRINSADGKTRWINVVGRSVSGIGDKPLGIRFSFRDITDRKIMEEQLRHQALHDPLTSVANRTLCLDRVSQAMRRARRRENYFFAVVFLDLDRFKIVNDSLGHHYGDMVLTETAIRLSKEMRGLDTVSRFGGDEFVLLLDELSSPGEALRIVKRIRLKLSEPFRLLGKEVKTTASFGIVLSPVPNTKAADILQHANIAMHRAKEAGRNRFKVFTNRMLETAVDQLTMENDMRHGLEEGDFHVAYQPIMQLGGSDIIGFEALARWKHPDRGNIPPAEFIPMAEESGLISQIGKWILFESLRTLAQWQKQTPDAKGLFMSVNLSSKQFARIDLDSMILNALTEQGLSPDSLKLEITESAIMENPESAIRILNRLRAKGIRFSIDDFGTGYSSLSQLQQLPVDTLKVDRSFISRMKTDPENMEIVKAVIALAHSLDLSVIAEGVEKPDQLHSLMQLKCECVQGFYFHEPMSSENALELVLRRTTSTRDQTEQKMTRAQAERRVDEDE